MASCFTERPLAEVETSALGLFRGGAVDLQLINIIMSIHINVSIGEFLDKLSILEIKRQRIRDPDKLVNIDNELSELRRCWQASKYAEVDIAALLDELRATNQELWDIEDRIREREAAGDFGSDFIALARAVSLTNDRRAAIKRQLNEKLGSTLIEEKSYSDYSGAAP
jgi:hypothetical protein